MVNKEEIKETFIILLIFGIINTFIGFYQTTSIQIIAQYFIGFVTGLYFAGTLRND